MKTCTKCKENKPTTEYNKMARYSDGLFCYCKDCQKDVQYKRRYGLSKKEVEQMLEDQEGLCALCGNPAINPQVDHCHETNKVRGVLCRHCNVGLGHFFDNVSYLEKAISYLNNV